MSKKLFLQKIAFLLFFLHLSADKTVLVECVASLDPSVSSIGNGQIRSTRKVIVARLSKCVSHQ